MPDTPTPPFTLPPLVAYIVAVISSVVGLLFALGIVDNHTEKLVGGLASILIPFAFVIANAVVHHGALKVIAAREMRAPRL